MTISMRMGIHSRTPIRSTSLRTRVPLLARTFSNLVKSSYKSLRKKIKSFLIERRINSSKLKNYITLWSTLSICSRRYQPTCKRSQSRSICSLKIRTRLIRICEAEIKPFEKRRIEISVAPISSLQFVLCWDLRY